MTRCERCNRVLTNKASIAARKGKRCAFLDALDAEFTPKQIEDAQELVADGGIQRSLTRPNLFTVVSSDGSRTYLAARQACTCPAGRKSRNCLHRAAVRLTSQAA